VEIQESLLGVIRRSSEIEELEEESEEGSEGALTVSIMEARLSASMLTSVSLDEPGIAIRAVGTGFVSCIKCEDR